MVSFICNACGQTVRKNQVEKHYQTVCRQCDVLSCIDCGKDFHGEEYAAHTSCISEAEKYQGKLFQPKEKANKGEQKQQEWIKQLHQVPDSVDPSIKKHLQRLKQYSNIPRKKAKFQNFCKNSVKIYDQSTLDKLWDAFSGADKNQQSSNGEARVSDQDNEQERNTESSKEETDDKETKKTEKKEKKKKKKEVEVVEERKKTKKKITDEECEQNGLGKKNKRKRRQDENKNEKDEPMGKITKIEENNNMEEEMLEEKDIQGKFNWGRVIKRALKEAPDNELPVKKLRKKVLAEFKSREDDKPFSNNELRALFDKKLNKHPKIKVKKEVARLCKKS